MVSDRSPDFRSREWIAALQIYARGLSQWLSRDLSQLSDTGLKLEKSERRALSVQEANLELEQAANWLGRKDSRAVYPGTRRSIAPPVEDLKMLEQWVETAAGPLILIAPFGSGKSVLLAAFACQQADRVVHWCEDKGRGDLPLIPWPVRLRGWKWHEEESFFAYVSKRSQQVLGANPSRVLAERHVALLAEAGKLLPLYDGFDELAEDAMARRAALRAMPQLTERFILSTRPGHGAEYILKENDKCQQHTLRELTVPDAEEFIRQRLNNAEGRNRLPALDAYRRARPYINQFFQRPLFLMAWCVNYEAASGHPATTLSELMDVVLMQVFAAGVFKGLSHLPVKNGDDIRTRRHELGALLAAYAEEGFGTLCYPSRIDEMLTADRTMSSLISTADWRKLAIRAGLLIEVAETCYVIKTPVVEHLIGAHYAMLVKPSDPVPDTSQDHRRQQLFVSKFRRGFWWREFEDIWMHAFDQLWRGETAQPDMANSVVNWLLDYSKRCLTAGQYAGELLPDQTAEDGAPWTCHRFAIRVLLPIGPVSPAANKQVEELLNSGLNQIMDELHQTWRRFPGKKDNLDLLAQRWPLELMQRLNESLALTSHQEVWNDIANAMQCVMPYLGSDDAKDFVINTLMPYLANTGYTDIWGYITKAIRSGLEQMSRADVKQVVVGILVPAMGNAKYKAAWGSIADAIASGFGQMEGGDIKQVLARTLVPYLAGVGYKDIWGHIAIAVRNGLWRMASRDAMQVVDGALLPKLGSAEYHAVSSSIADAIATGFGRMTSEDTERVVLKTLLPYLADDDQKLAWGDIIHAVSWGLGRMESEHAKQVVVEALLHCLATADYKEVWGHIIPAIDCEERVEKSGKAKLGLVGTLLPYLAKPGYLDIRGDIIDAIGRKLLRVDSGVAKQVVVETLVPLIPKGENNDTWFRIVKAIGDGLSKMNSGDAREVVVETLMPYMADNEYNDKWTSIALLIGRGLCSMESADAKQVVVETLVPHLDEAVYKDAWESITYAIHMGIARMERKSATQVVFKKLVPYLARSGHRHAWFQIFEAIKCGLAWMPSGDAKQVIVETLLPCLTKAQHKGEWSCIAKGIGEALRRMEHGDTKQVVVEALLPFLGRAGCKDVWWHIAIAIAHGGEVLTENEAPALDAALVANSRIDDLSYIVDLAPRLRWFVRRIADHQQPNRITYGICGRNDPQLLFDPTLQCAPQFILRLVADAADSRIEAVEFPWLETDGVAQAMVKAVETFRGSEQAYDFSREIGARQNAPAKEKTKLAPRKTRRVKALLRVLWDFVPKDKRQQFQKAVDAPVPGNRLPKSLRSRTLVNPNILAEVLAKHEAVKEIYYKGMGNKIPHIYLLTRLGEEARYLCPECGALNEPDSLDSDVRPPEKCVACRGKLPTAPPFKCPPDEQLLICRKCWTRFKRQPRRQPFQHEIRIAGRCPGEDCQKPPQSLQQLAEGHRENRI